MSLTTATCGFCRNNLTSGSTAERTFPLHLKGASDFNFSIGEKKEKKIPGMLMFGTINGSNTLQNVLVGTSTRFWVLFLTALQTNTEGMPFI